MCGTHHGLNIARPKWLARIFAQNGLSMLLGALIAVAVISMAISINPAREGQGFYQFLPHNVMVAIFAPAFVLPLIWAFLSLKSYWRDVGGSSIKWKHIVHATQSAATLKNLKGGHGLGCNFEKEDRFSSARRHAHHAVFYGFLLCFASTSVATIMHYVLSWPAPYPLLSLPKILGIAGGVLLSVGAPSLLWLKLKSDRSLGSSQTWNGDLAFVMITGLTGFTGLMLYGATGTNWVPFLLALHLGIVLLFFLTLPFSKMMHGFFRILSLIKDAQDKDKSTQNT